MKEKENTVKKEVGELNLTKMIQEQIYNINIQAHKIEDTTKKTINIAVWADRWSQNLLYKIFLIFQTELEYVTKLMSNEDLFSFVCDILVDEFHNEIKDKKDLENCIDNRIKQLEGCMFLTSRDLYTKYNELEDEYMEISFNDVKEIFLSLRKRKIDLYKAILKEFRNDKEKYISCIKEQVDSFY